MSLNVHRTTTEFNCGIDLHGTSMYVCVMNRAGQVLVHRKVRQNDLAYLGKLLAPYRHDLTVCCESTFNWYFLADWCWDQGLVFVLGHAAMIRAVHQAKVKNDRVDSETLAGLLRSSLLPCGHACRRPWRDVRDLLRRRQYFVQSQTGLKAFLAMSVQALGHAPLATSEKARRQRREALTQRADTATMALSYSTTVDLIESYDRSIRQIERHVEADAHANASALLAVLLSIPAVGQIRGLTLLYEIVDIARFPTAKAFCSYARVIVPVGTSNEKACGRRGFKQGNPYLKWVFSELAVHIGHFCPQMAVWVADLEKRHGPRGARHRVAHRLAITVYYLLKRREHFDLNVFFKGQERYLKHDAA